MPAGGHASRGRPDRAHRIPGGAQPIKPACRRFTDGRRLIHVSEPLSGHPRRGGEPARGRRRRPLPGPGRGARGLWPSRSAGRTVPGPRIGEITGPAAAGRAAAQATGPPRTSAPAAYAAPFTAPAAQVAANPYERGPNLTVSSIEAVRGPFAIAETDVSSLRVTGFGGGTIYYPTGTGEGTFGAVAIAPGYTADKSSMAWLAPRIASQGFVVFNLKRSPRLKSGDSSQLGLRLHDGLSRCCLAVRLPAHAVAWFARRERHDRPGGLALEAVLQQPAVLAGQGLPGARRRRPPRAPAAGALRGRLPGADGHGSSR
ncbi:hypothetical protein SAMN05216275_13857 [Streptosporangium canum]|uniref:poly(ethylene terephthalate) hydrolase n=1 Tax=Streptosporangium canum TaxID=324952 RepID=A0A1I4D078_9ACTN|nr:hypothetical protein SAMN05216275_13857 [Streptosporangium canum]